MPNHLRHFAKRSLNVACFVLFLSASTAFAQTSTFTYQGRLTDGGTAANGTYDFQFKLYDALTNGNLQGSPNTVAKTGVNVTNGIFTVQLDFGAGAFPGADRFLEISVQHNGGGFTTLTPRQQLTSSPYSIRTIFAGAADSLSSACVACVNDSHINSVAGSKVTGTVANATNFSGNLGGNVTGTQSATVVSSVGGQTAANVATGTQAANNATAANTPNTIVKRDASGNFAAGTITANLSGNATTATNATQLGGVAASNYVQTSDSRLSDARTPTGSAGGALSGTYPNPSLASGAVTTSKIAPLPSIRVLQTSAQTFPDNVFPKVNLDTVSFASDITFSNPNDEVTIHTSGVYMITAEIIWTQNGTGSRALSIVAGGVEVAFDAGRTVPELTSISTATMIVRLNAGDTVSLTASQSSGGNLATDASFGGRSAALSLAWMSP